MGIASAPGKVIITGEHSVVYGKPALAAALDLRCIAEVEDAADGLTIVAPDLGKTIHYGRDELEMISRGVSIEGEYIHYGFDNLAMAVTTCIAPEDVAHSIRIRSEVPIGAGLGSSAATSVAIIGSLFDHLGWDWDPTEISSRAFEAERVAHGKPSGIDNTVASLGGLIHYHDGSITAMKISSSIPLVIANTGVERNTKALVSAVRKRRDAFPVTMDAVLESMANCSEEIADNIQAGNHDYIGQLFDINQGLLDAIGVNHPRLSELISIARENGALGAKLTGAGGGGCMIALVDDVSSTSVAEEMASAGFEVYKTSISPVGVIRGADRS